MPASKISHADFVEAVRRHQRPDGTVDITGLSSELAIDSSSARKRVLRYAAEGAFGTRPVLPGFGITQVSTQNRGGETVGESIQQRPIGEKRLLPANFDIKQITTYESSSGSTGVWTQARPGAFDQLAFIEELRGAFADFQPAAPPLPITPGYYADQLALYPWSDPHFGMAAWKGETGINWDLKIAVKTIREMFAKIVAKTPATKRAILIIGGDILHVDNDKSTTTRGTFQDTDGRHSKVALAACETAAHNIGLLLTRHEEVEVIVLPGNHDETSFYTVTLFLSAWFRHDPRVIVDLSPAEFRYRQFGKVMIATNHGHNAKPEKMPLIMAAREYRMWGDTKHRYAHTFHVHKQSKDISEQGGVVSEQHRILAPHTGWSFGVGYESGRSLQSITYDRDRGETGRSQETL